MVFKNIYYIYKNML